MGKKKKKSDDLKKYLPAAALVGGVLIAVFGRKWFESATDKFVAGIGVKFSNLKLKIVGIVNLQVTAIMLVTNTNSIGGKVINFTGVLKYGKNGAAIMPLNVQQFNLPANGTASAQVIAQIGIAQLGSNIYTVVKSIIDGSLKKLWLTGTLQTTFAPIPIDTEITPFSE